MEIFTDGNRATAQNALKERFRRGIYSMSGMQIPEHLKNFCF